jgi:hypothetical protein
VLSRVHIEIVVNHEKLLGSKLDLFLCVQQQVDLFRLDHIDDKQRCVFVVEVDFFDTIAKPLSEVISVFVFSNAGVKVIDDLPVLEFPLFLVAPVPCSSRKNTAASLGITISGSGFFIISSKILPNFIFPKSLKIVPRIPDFTSTKPIATAIAAKAAATANKGRFTAVAIALTAANTDSAAVAKVI